MALRSLKSRLLRVEAAQPVCRACAGGRPMAVHFQGQPPIAAPRCAACGAEGEIIQVVYEGCSDGDDMSWVPLLFGAGGPVGEHTEAAREVPRRERTQ